MIFRHGLIEIIKLKQSEPWLAQLKTKRKEDYHTIPITEVRIENLISNI